MFWVHCEGIYDTLVTNQLQAVLPSTRYATTTNGPLCLKVQSYGLKKDWQLDWTAVAVACLLYVIKNWLLSQLQLATVLSANQSASKVGIVNTFKVTKSKNHENNQDLTELLIFTNVTTFFMLLQSNFTNIFINTSILYQIQCFIAHFKARKHDNNIFWLCIEVVKVVKPHFYNRFFPRVLQIKK